MQALLIKWQSRLVLWPRNNRRSDQTRRFTATESSLSASGRINFGKQTAPRKVAPTHTGIAPVGG